MPLTMTCDRCGCLVKENSRGGAIRFSNGNKEFRKQYLCATCVVYLSALLDDFVAPQGALGLAARPNTPQPWEGRLGTGLEEGD